MNHHITRNEIDEILELDKGNRRTKLEAELEMATKAIASGGSFTIGDKNNPSLTITTKTRLDDYKINARALLDLSDQRDDKVASLYC